MDIKASVQSALEGVLAAAKIQTRIIGLSAVAVGILVCFPLPLSSEIILGGIISVYGLITAAG